MKSLALVVLCAATLALAGAGAAQAFTQPIQNANYVCSYYNYHGLAQNPGLSSFYVNPAISNSVLLRGIETFSVTYPPYSDQQKFTFAKPVDFYYGSGYFGTRWEFTVNPSGPQCKSTEVVDHGARIYFNDCTDGHSRVCSLL